MRATYGDAIAITTGYYVNTGQYLTDGAINSSRYGDVIAATTGNDVNTTHYVTKDTINSGGFGDGNTHSLSTSGCLVVNTSALLFYDDSDDPISTATIKLFNRVTATVLIPTLFFIGFPTNCLSMLVFFKHDLKQRINTCLFCLSLVDLVFITFTFLKYVDQVRAGALSASNRTTETVVLFIVNNHLLGFSGFGWASLYVSAIISGERCFCVIWPLRSSTLLKTQTTAVMLFVGVVLIVGGRFTVTEKYRIMCLYDVASEQENFRITASRYYFAHKQLVDVLDGVVYGLVLPVTTCTFVTIATVVTTVKLKLITQWRQEASSALSAREIALTRMLIYLSVQFIFLNLPNILLRVTSIFVPDLSFTGRFAHLFFFMSGIAEVCAALNSSLNFLVYYFAGTKYRETVRGLCGSSATKKKAAHVDTSVSNVNSSPLQN